MLLFCQFNVNGQKKCANMILNAGMVLHQIFSNQVQHMIKKKDQIGSKVLYK